MSSSGAVITGIGVVSPFGIGKQPFIAGVRRGISRVSTIERFDTSSIRSRKGSLVSELQLKPPNSSLGRLPLVYQYGILAAEEALQDSTLDLGVEDKDRVGIFFGTACNADQTARYHLTLIEKSPNLVSPLHFQNTTYMAGPGTISIRQGITGPAIALPGGYCSALQALDMAVSYLAQNKLGIALVVGADELSRLHYEALGRLNLLSTSRKDNDETSRPFDAQRDGMIAGEGAGALVLESLSHAAERGAGIYAELAGVGIAHDAYKSADISPDGRGLDNAMRMALTEADVSLQSVDYIAAAANSTKALDAAEARAIKRLFKENAHKVAISSIKSMIGETFAAGGILNVIACVAAINGGFIPPTLNYRYVDPDCDINVVAGGPHETKVETALANCYSFGGSSGSALVRGFQ